MTAYLTIAISDNVLEELSNFEIAAFCGDECRGVATILTAENGEQSTCYAYLRIRSNQQSGDNITFKVYHKLQATEMTIEHDPLVFQSQEAVGMPSSPMVITVTDIIPGDANNDGLVNAADLSAVINKILMRPNATFNEIAADMNGDGVINAADLSAIINIILKR